MKHRRSIIALVLAGLVLVAVGSGELLAGPEEPRTQAASAPCVIDMTVEGLSATGDCPGTITVDTDGAAYFQGERSISTPGEGSCTLAYESVVTGTAIVLWANPGYALKPAAGTDCPTGTQVRFHDGLDAESRVVVDTVGVDDLGFPADHPFGEV